MIKAIGLDLVEVARIEKNIDKYKSRFINKILGPDELKIFEQRYDQALFVAGRFAAKEAVIKGLGSVLTERPSLAEIQVLNDSLGMPALQLSEDLTKRLTHIEFLISITHERHYAAAVAVLWEKK